MPDEVYSLVSVEEADDRPGFFWIVISSPFRGDVKYLQLGPTRGQAAEKAGKAVDGLNFQGWRNLPMRG